MKIVAVSGGTGFIGRNLIKELEKEFKVLLIRRSDFDLDQYAFDKKLMAADAIFQDRYGRKDWKWRTIHVLYTYGRPGIDHSISINKQKRWYIQCNKPTTC